jgi:hypothetical protein
MIFFCRSVANYFECYVLYLYYKKLRVLLELTLISLAHAQLPWKWNEQKGVKLEVAKVINDNLKK